MNLDVTEQQLFKMTAEQRVDRGVAWLDSNHPDWEQNIATDRLWIENCKRCVLGQLFGDYHEGLTRIGVGRQGTAVRAASLGFTIVWNVDPVTFPELESLWRSKIEARQGGTAPAV